MRSTSAGSGTPRRCRQGRALPSDPPRARPGRSPRHRILVQVGDEDVGALPGEGQGHGAADAAIPSGDEGDFALQAAMALVGRLRRSRGEGSSLTRVRGTPGAPGGRGFGSVSRGFSVVGGRSWGAPAGVCVTQKESSGHPELLDDGYALPCHAPRRSRPWQMKRPRGRIPISESSPQGPRPGTPCATPLRRRSPRHTFAT